MGWEFFLLRKSRDLFRLWDVSANTIFPIFHLPHWWKGSLLFFYLDWTEKSLSWVEKFCKSSPRSQPTSLLCFHFELFAKRKHSAVLMGPECHRTAHNATYFMPALHWPFEAIVSQEIEVSATPVMDFSQNDCWLLMQNFSALKLHCSCNENILTQRDIFYVCRLFHVKKYTTKQQNGPKNTRYITSGCSVLTVLRFLDWIFPLKWLGNAGRETLTAIITYLRLQCSET